MRVRNKESRNIEGFSSKFNTCATGEIIVSYDEGDMSSDFISNYEVQLSSGEWKDLKQAFDDKDLITDNYDTRFFEPANEEDKQRGWAY